MVIFQAVRMPTLVMWKAAEGHTLVLLEAALAPVLIMLMSPRNPRRRCCTPRCHPLWSCKRSLPHPSW